MVTSGVVEALSLAGIVHGEELIFAPNPNEFNLIGLGSSAGTTASTVAVRFEGRGDSLPSSNSG